MRNSDSKTNQETLDEMFVKKLKARNFDQAKYLLSKGANINTTFEGKPLIIYFAGITSFSELVKFLVDNGANTLIENKQGIIALDEGLTSQNFFTIETLLKDYIKKVKKSSTEKFLLSIIEQDEKKTKSLLKKGVSIEVERMGVCALMLAAALEDSNMLKFLIKEGARTNQKDTYSRTALFWATQKDRYENVKILLKNKAKVNWVDNYDRTPLSIAVYRSQEITKLLLKHKADPNIKLTKPILIRSTFNPAIIKMLVEAGADVNVRGINGKTALMEAAYYGQKVTLEYLIKMGANVKAVDEFGSNALDYANRMLEESKEYGDYGEMEEYLTSIVKILKKLGLAPGLRDDEKVKMKELLFYGCRKNDLEKVKIALDNGADVNSVDGNMYNFTPLIYASHNGNLEIFKFLIKNKADVNAKAKKGWSPLMRAVYENHLEIVKELIKVGANIEIKSDGGWTPLMYATDTKKLKILKYLIKKGANVNAYDKDGTTALMIASRYGHKKTVEILLKNGADIKMKDNLGDALYYSKRFKRKEIEKLLLKFTKK